MDEIASPSQDLTLDDDIDNFNVDVDMETRPPTPPYNSRLQMTFKMQSRHSRGSWPFFQSDDDGEMQEEQDEHDENKDANVWSATHSSSRSRYEHTLTSTESNPHPINLKWSTNSAALPGVITVISISTCPVCD